MCHLLLALVEIPCVLGVTPDVHAAVVSQDDGRVHVYRYKRGEK